VYGTGRATFNAAAAHFPAGIAVQAAAGRKRQQMGVGNGIGFGAVWKFYDIPIGQGFKGWPWCVSLRCGARLTQSFPMMAHIRRFYWTQGGA
jgi:hypothetical protein